MESPKAVGWDAATQKALELIRDELREIPSFDASFIPKRLEVFGDHPIQVRLFGAVALVGAAGRGFAHNCLCAIGENRDKQRKQLRKKNGSGAKKSGQLDGARLRVAPKPLRLRWARESWSQIKNWCMLSFTL